VIVDGAAWHGEVVATLRRGGGWSDEKLQTDGDGRLRLDRDPFLDSKAPVRGLRVQTPRLDGPAGTWFAAESRAPRNLNSTTVISVETQSVTMVLADQHAGGCADGTCRVQLEAEMPVPIDDGSEAGAEYRSFEAIGASRPLRPAERRTVRLARGYRYRAVVEGARGSWTSPVMILRAQPVTLTLRGDRLRTPEEELQSLAEAYGR
jgi:hypothetical protein